MKTQVASCVICNIYYPAAEFVLIVPENYGSHKPMQIRELTDSGYSGVRCICIHCIKQLGRIDLSTTPPTLKQSV